MTARLSRLVLGLVALLSVSVITVPAQATPSPLNLQGVLSTVSAILGQPVTYSGTVQPAVAGEQVALYGVDAQGASVLLGSGLTNASGAFSVRLSSTLVGVTNLVAKLIGDTGQVLTQIGAGTLNIVRAATRVVASATSAVLTRGRAAILAGSVHSGVAGVRAVQARLRIPGGWAVLASGTTASNGSYRLKLPTWWYRRGAVQIYATATATAAAAVSTAQSQSVVPSYRPRGRASDWARLSGAARRWNPCAPITWRFNPTGAPSGAFADVRRAISLIGQGTGMQFRYAGHTSAIPGGRMGWPTGTGIVIAWATASQTNWGLGPGIGGVGGSVAETYAHDASGATVDQILSAGVVLNRNLKLRGGFGKNSMRGQILMHELGHAVGLGHARKPTEIMAPVAVWGRVAQWGAGDLTGLSRVGLLQGCITP